MNFLIKKLDFKGLLARLIFVNLIEKQKLSKEAQILVQ